MKQFPRTKLYLSILRQELMSLEGLSRLPAGSDGQGMTEMRRMDVVEQSIAEIEYLLELAEERGEGQRSSADWSSSQYWLILFVMVASGLLMGAGLWASLILR